MNRKAPVDKSGALAVVATPIGNLADIAPRAGAALAAADLILAEDTRRARVLLQHLGIRVPLRAYHRHNEAARLPAALRQLQGGAQLALISDAGTPLISDPGRRLVERARAAGIRVTPLPGACAITAALSAAGQCADRFCFEGFLPATFDARARRLRELQYEARTLVFFEASHRIRATLTALAAVFGGERQATVAREISKQFETFYAGTLIEITAEIASAERHRKGEFVIITAGAERARADESRAGEVMALLCAEMPLKRASQIGAQILGLNRNELYQMGLGIKGGGR